MRANHADLWQAVGRAQPGRIAIRSIDGERWTYGRFIDEAEAFASFLAVSGIARGDRVAMLLYNRPEFLIAFFACLSAGVTPVPLNYRLRGAEVAALLDDSGARVLLHPTSLAAEADEAVALADHAVLRIAIADDAHRAPQAVAWRETVRVPGTPGPVAPVDGELWIYTGGTTGRPKAVRWSAHDMFEAQLVPTYTLAGLPIPTTLAEAVAIAVDPGTPAMVNLPLAPFMHGTALTTSMNTLSLGGTVLVTSSPRLDADAAVAFAVDAGATRVIVAGDAIAIPLADAAERAGLTLPSVTSMMSSGMRFSPETKRRIHGLGSIAILDMLASTEGGAFAVTTTTSAADLPGRAALLPTASVLDDRRRDVTHEPGALGILAQHGALPLGYHGDPEKTAETFPVIDGVRYVVPGDWVRVEEDGTIELLGRGTGVINTGGEKVYPLEVEEALLAHPRVADAVVLGMPDPRFGEVVTAVVKRRDPGLEEAELLQALAAHLAGYKKPRRIHFRDALERSPTGKIDLVALRAELLAAPDRSV